MGPDFVYYDAWLRRMVSVEVVASRAIVTHAVSDDMPTGWVHYEDEEEWRSRDATHDYRPTSGSKAVTPAQGTESEGGGLEPFAPYQNDQSGGYYRYGQPPQGYYYPQPHPGPAESSAVEVTVVRPFLEETLKFHHRNDVVFWRRYYFSSVDEWVDASFHAFQTVVNGVSFCSG